MTTPVRVLISADMEGVSGVVHTAETNPGQYDYERGRSLMTAEVNAAIEGVLAAEPDATVRVADAHGPFRNLLPEDLHRQARLIRGRPRALGMLAGVDDGVDVVLFVGYHGRAGSGPAVLAHTIGGDILDLRVNGEQRGEIGLNAALAGHYGAPVILLSGDDVACAELTDIVPRAVTVPVKRALGQLTAETLHPEVARDLLRTGAADAMRRRSTVRPFTVAEPVKIEIDLYRPHAVDLAALIPGVSRAPGARTVGFTAPDMLAAYRLVALITQLAQLPA